MNLNDLPNEIINYLSQYVPSKDIIFSLALVSKRFHQIFLDQNYWLQRCNNVRINMVKPIIIETRTSQDTVYKEPEEKHYDYKYPPTLSDNYDWLQSCYESEYLYNVWPNAEKMFYHYKYRQDSAIDVIKLINKGKTCVTGSRDRSIHIYDVSLMGEGVEEEKALINRAVDVHKGWIWTLSFVNDQRFCSGGWDSWLKIWDLTSDARIQESQAIKCESAILCSHYASPGLIAVGMYHKTVKLLDPRTYPCNNAPPKKENLECPLTIPLHTGQTCDPYSRVSYDPNGISKVSPNYLYRQTEPEIITVNGFKNLPISGAPLPAIYSNDKKLHSGPILCLTVDRDRDLLITGSEDKTLHISDLRFLKQQRSNPDSSTHLDKDKSDNLFLSRDSFTSLEESHKSPIKSLFKIPLCGIPLTMSYDANCLWVGDDLGNLYLFDPSQNFKEIGKFYSGHAYSIRNVKHTSPGCGLLFTCSADKSFKVWDPSWPPRLIYSQKMCLESEMASLDYLKEIFAVASADGAVNVWKPK